MKQKIKIGSCLIKILMSFLQVEKMKLKEIEFQDTYDSIKIIVKTRENQVQTIDIKEVKQEVVDKMGTVQAGIYRVYG